MRYKTWKRLLIWLCGLAAAGAAALGGINGRVYLKGRSLIRTPDGVRPAQVALVLGALVFPDGTVSDMVADRLQTALDLYQSGKVKKLLITGDHGQQDYDEVNTMRRWLEKQGVPPQDIFMDHAGFDTYNSMYRAKSVFQVHDAVVVTQRFHLTRALYLADQLGLEAQGVVADRHLYRGARYYDLRELGARVKAFGEAVSHRRPVFLGPVIPITGDGRETHDQPA